MKFQWSYFKSWKIMLSKCCTQYAGKFGKQQWPQDWKRSVFIPIPKKGNAKKCSNYCTIALISHARKVMLKILQSRLQQYMSWELPNVQAGFRKGRGSRDQIANVCWIIEKAREFQKNIYYCFIDYDKAFEVKVHLTSDSRMSVSKWSHHHGYLGHEDLFCWKILKRWEYQTTLPASWEICMQVKKQPWELYM